MDRKYGQWTDEQLAGNAQQGDLEAEEYLIRRYKDVVIGRAQLYFIMGADGDDVVQEGMIGIFKAIKSYNDQKDASFRTFAEICINRQIATAIKSACRMKHSPLNTSISLNRPISEEKMEGTLQEILATDGNSDPEETLLLKDIVAHILSNDSKLFSDFEMQVWNEYLQGKKCRQIAENLGKSTKAVDNAMQRTKKKIITYMCQ